MVAGGGDGRGCHHGRRVGGRQGAWRGWVKEHDGQVHVDYQKLVGEAVYQNEWIRIGDGKGDTAMEAVAVGTEP
eukprot:405105-Prymnesium_polylepis.1